jgi:hypothetical protein
MGAIGLDASFPCAAINKNNNKPLRLNSEAFSVTPNFNTRPDAKPLTILGDHLKGLCRTWDRLSLGFLNSAEGKDKVIRFLRATMKGRAVAEKDFRAVAGYAKAKPDLSEKATQAQRETNTRPLALDEVFFEDFCSLGKWAMKDKVTSLPLDFSKFTWRDGLMAIDPKLAPVGPPPC